MASRKSSPHFFVDRYAACGWADAELRRQFEEGVAENLGYCFDISVALDSIEIEKILGQIRASDTPDAVLLGNVETESSPQVVQILHALRTGSETESASLLIQITN